MSARRTQVVIVGAGLAGVYAAWRLEQQGLRDHVLLEARDAPGGRIASLVVPAGSAPDGAAAGASRFDLGPAWFWPEQQPELAALVEHLGLERFPQHEAGDMMIERSPQAAPERYPGYATAPASMRLAGGMGALVDALRNTLDPGRIATGQTVSGMRIENGVVRLHCEDQAGRASAWNAAQVLLAVPPRLAAHTIAFDPALPPALIGQWRATPTWMAAHAKYIAVYDAPFWRGHGLSGEARSARGPMAEIHDASVPGGGAALFGFFGVPAQVRRSVGEDALRAHCRAQLARLFGPQAATPRTDAIKDWALDPYTSTAADLGPAGPHAAAPAATPASGPWAGRLVGIASEWSPRFPGYVAGAIEAAGNGVRTLTSQAAATHASTLPDACPATGVAAP